jgi:cell division septal protein FtsQ
MAGKNDKSASGRENTKSSSRRLIIIAVMAAVCLSLGLGMIAFLKHRLYTRNPKFIIDKIDKVEISGLNKLDRKKLLDEAEIVKLTVNKNLFDIPLKTLRKNIKKNPLVAEVEIRRVLPGSMIIKVTERVPVVRLAKADPATALLVDRLGIVMPPVYHNDFKMLPVLAGHPAVLKAVAGTPLDARLLPVLDLLNYISTNTDLSMAMDIKTLYFEENNFIPTVKLVLRQRFPFCEGATVRMSVAASDYQQQQGLITGLVQDSRKQGLEIISTDVSLQNSMPYERRPATFSYIAPVPETPVPPTVTPPRRP